MEGGEEEDDRCVEGEEDLTIHSTRGSLMKTFIVLRRRSEFSRKAFIVWIIVARKRPAVPMGDINCSI